MTIGRYTYWTKGTEVRVRARVGNGAWLYISLTYTFQCMVIGIRTHIKGPQKR
jgi:hypothetical protein